MRIKNRKIKSVRKMKALLQLALVLFAAAGLIGLSRGNVFADPADTAFPTGEAAYVNPSTGFQVFIDDEAELLTPSEEIALAEIMKSVTEYGGAAFCTGYYYGYDTNRKTEELRDLFFGNTSSTVFMIDMGNRNIWIQSGGAVYEVVNKAYANTITDNVYRYASRGKYYDCAAQAFTQMNTLLAGGRIARPMKYITNALISLILALLINFFYLKRTARIAKPTKEELLGALTIGFLTSSRGAAHIRTTRRYRGGGRSGGGFGGGFSGGGFGGGGGGFSSGGGGHSF